MKKSLMHNIKNFVDSNVLQRIDRVANHYSEPFSDDILAVERHFEDIRQVCLDADKKISALLQSIHLASNPSHLGTYTQNVQAGLNNLSHNIGLQAANIASVAATSSSASASAPASSSSNTNPALAPGQHLRGNENILKSNHHSPELAEPNLTRQPSCNSSGQPQYRSDESLSNGSNTFRIHTHNDTIPSQHTAPESNCPLSEHLSEDVQNRYKKLPVVGFYKFLIKSSQKLKQDSLLAIALSHCTQLQIQSTNLYLTYERLIETQCLKPIQHMIESDIPNIIKFRKLYIKSHNDYESLKTKYNGVSLKQQHQQLQQHNLQPGQQNNSIYSVAQNTIQQGNLNKLDSLKNELDEAVTRFEQSKDTYEAELYGFVCRETELVNLLKKFYQYQTEYHLQVGSIMQGLMPTLTNALALTPRKSAFGTPLGEHLRCTGREISPVIELCVHFLNLQGLKEEGLFRIPGSSVKMKKLKNGINAWFLSLASLHELESDTRQPLGHNCMNALYDLFKNSLGKRVHVSQSNYQSSSFAQSASKCNSPENETFLDQCNVNSESHDDDDMILDIHSVAGLLKLYLRELPEPLFTFALYDDWIRCVDSKLDNVARLKLMSAVIVRLPCTHRENLKHLIKFLHLLTQHQEQNKMTSTNLAIAMAPSLMWPKPVETNCQVMSNSDEAQSLNMQMSSFGISASHHAMILEAFINNADALFPETCDFSLPGFENLKLQLSKHRSSNRSRSVKSTSPTGISTTSSSSFSSSASNPASSSAMIRGHSRKGGSMEGLLDKKDVNHFSHDGAKSVKTRPVSVQMQLNEYSAIMQQQQQQRGGTPQKPPPPRSFRSQSRQGSHNGKIHLPTPSRSHNKPPAPPVPPPTSVRHQVERNKAASTVSAVGDQTVIQKPRPVSLRGTGTIDNSGGSQITRPSVPPPATPKEKNSDKPDMDVESVLRASFKKSDNSAQVDETVPNSQCSNTTGMISGNGMNASSPVASLDSVCEGDSSFDNDSCHSHDQSWDKCSLPNNVSADGGGVGRQEAEARDKLDSLKVEDGGPPAARAGSTSSPTLATPKCQGDTMCAPDHRDIMSSSVEADDEHKRPPIKPPRSGSPKVTQSTPL